MIFHIIIVFGTTYLYCNFNFLKFNNNLPAQFPYIYHK